MHENSTLNIGNSTFAHIARKDEVYDRREVYDSLRPTRSAIFAFNKSRKFLRDIYHKSLAIQMSTKILYFLWVIFQHLEQYLKS